MNTREELTAKDLWHTIVVCTPRQLKGDARFTVQRELVLYWLMVHQVYSHKRDLPRMAADKAALKRCADPLACATQVFFEEESRRHQKLYECYERLANECLRRLNRVFNKDHRLTTYRAWVRMTAHKWLVFREGG